VPIANEDRLRRRATGEMRVRVLCGFWGGSVAGTVQASASRSRPTACRPAGAAASHRWRGVCLVSECTCWSQALCTQWSQQLVDLGQAGDVVAARVAVPGDLY